jgi:hypothetical protein
MAQLNWVEKPMEVQAVQWTGDLNEFKTYIPDCWGASEDRVGFNVGTPVQSTMFLRLTEWVVVSNDGHVEAYTDSQFQQRFAPGQDVPLAITTLDPSEGVAGAEDVTMTITGTGFTGASVILWNEGEERTDFITPTQVSTIVSLSIFGGADVFRVRVKNPMQISNELQFTMLPPVGE